MIVRLGAVVVMAMGIALAGAAASTTAPPPLFGTAEIEVEAPAGPRQWREMLRRMAIEEPALRACAADLAACPDDGARAWLAFLQGLEGASRAEQVRAVNLFVNRWRYKTDLDNWGVRDRWATPLEFIRFSGDCEDYAILKYDSLRRLGFAPQELRLAIVQDTSRDIAHAVLAVHLEGEIVILDNLSDQVLPQRLVRHYAPYYSLNEAARWVHVGSGAAVFPAGREPSPPARPPAAPRP